MCQMVKKTRLIPTDAPKFPKGGASSFLEHWCKGRFLAPSIHAGLKLCPKTPFPHQSSGFGIPFLLVFQPSRVPDAVHKANVYCHWGWAPATLPYGPSALFNKARASLYGPCSQPPLPFATAPNGIVPCPSVHGT